MIVLGFFFAAVSGNLVGMIGSSNNPVSGLTLCTLVIAALLMVALGVSGTGGVAAVLGVAAVVCVSSAVAGEMLQDLKVGHILGGTPAKMQIGDLFGIVVASLVLFFPLAILDKAYHFGSAALPAPQAGLMAMLAKGIVGGDMAWPLVIVGILMGLAMIMIEVKSVMLFAVGMYLPLGTTFAIFVGGVIRWVTDKLRDRRGLNDAQKARVDNCRRAHRLGTDRRRSAVRAGHRRTGGVGPRCDAVQVDAAVLSGADRARRAGPGHDPGAAGQRRPAR